MDLYVRWGPHGEPEIVQRVVSPGGTILELGCGAGRITTPLVQMGYDVTAVDNSDDMLAFVRGARIVKSDIETLDLGRTFDAVLLMSHLINTPDDSERREFIATCRRHVASRGNVILQRYDPKWLATVQVGSLGTTDGVEFFVDRAERNGPRVEMTMRWRVGQTVWTQSFVAQALAEDELAECLEEAGLTIAGWLDARRTWLVARPR